MSNNRKIYKEDFLLSKTSKQLYKFCKERKIPFVGLNKKKMAANIQEWSKGANKLEDFTFKGLADPDRIPDIKHVLNIKARRFCFEYSTRGSALTHVQWAKRIEVSPPTISKWLTWDESKALILSFQEKYEERILQKFMDEEEEVVTQLLNVIKQKKNTDVKRRAINDFLGYRGRVNVNEKSANINVNQNQKQGQATLVQNNIQTMSEEDINSEIKELEDMED